MNNIVRHFQETGIDPHIDRKKLERFAHASSKTYEEAMRLTSEIDSAFADLPASLRNMHHNDAQRWITSLANPTIDPVEKEPETAPESPSELPPTEPEKDSD